MPEFLKNARGPLKTLVLSISARMQKTARKQGGAEICATIGPPEVLRQGRRAATPPRHRECRASTKSAGRRRAPRPDTESAEPRHRMTQRLPDRSWRDRMGGTRIRAGGWWVGGARIGVLDASAARSVSHPCHLFAGGCAGPDAWRAARMGGIGSRIDRNTNCEKVVGPTQRARDAGIRPRERQESAGIRHRGQIQHPGPTQRTAAERRGPTEIETEGS